MTSIRFRIMLKINCRLSGIAEELYNNLPIKMEVNAVERMRTGTKATRCQKRETTVERGSTQVVNCWKIQEIDKISNRKD